MFSKSIQSTDIDNNNEYADDMKNLDFMLNSVSGLDLVGIYASGYIYTGFANSLGQFNWHATTRLVLIIQYIMRITMQLNLITHQKNGVITRNLNSTWIKGGQLSILSKPSKTIEKGEYTAYLEPSALNEIIDMMSWGGFSYKANKIELARFIC